MQYKEFQIIRLKKNILSHNLKKGDLGAIVHVFNKPRLAYEIEFINKNGSTKIQLALTSDIIELVN